MRRVVVVVVVAVFVLPFVGVAISTLGGFHWHKGPLITTPGPQPRPRHP